MNLRYISTDIKEAATSLGFVFIILVVIGVSGLSPSVTKLTISVTQDQMLVKAFVALFHALAQTISFVPMAFMRGDINKGKNSHLSTLVALPITRLSLGVHRYLGILAVQGIIVLALVPFTALVEKLFGTNVVDLHMAAIVSQAFISLAIMAFYQLLNDILPGFDILKMGLFIMGIILFTLADAYGPTVLNDPFTVAAMSFTLIIIEIAVFSFRRTFV